MASPSEPWGYCRWSIPNHFWDIKNKSDEETVAFIKECVDIKHGLQEDYVKVYVINMQVVSQGFSPYFTLVGRPHTINERNAFEENNLKSCMEAEIVW